MRQRHPEKCARVFILTRLSGNAQDVYEHHLAINVRSKIVRFTDIDV